MNILIVNAFGNSISGKNKFNAFLSLIKSSFKKVSENSGIEKFNYIIRTPLTIGDFTYSTFTNPFEETSESKNRKNFNSLDMIFIDGTEIYSPWKEKSKKLFEFIKLCKLSNKVLFAGGVALQILIFYLSTGSLSEYTIINSKGEIKSLEEIRGYPRGYFKGTKKSEIFLDYVTGDLLEYRENDDSWEPFMNIGLHHQIMAEKYFNRGKFVLNDIFKHQQNYINNYIKTSSSYLMKDVISSEIKIKITKQYTSYYLLKNCVSEFVALCTLEWFPHFINFTSKKSQFRILSQSNKGPSIIEHENTVGVIFHPNPKYADSTLILKNFIKTKFNEVKDKLLGVKNINIYNSENKEKEKLKLFRLVNNNTDRAHELYNPEKNYELNNRVSLLNKVTKSCLFNITTNVKNEAKHVGQGINNREMIFVENNNINQRIFFRFKTYINKLKMNKEDNIKKEASSTTPRIPKKKLKLKSGFLLKKNRKGMLTLRKIKKPEELLDINSKNNFELNKNKNKYTSKSQKLKLSNLSNYTNIKTQNLFNKFQINKKNSETKNDDSNESSLDKENEDTEDFAHYKSKYPRLPTAQEIEKMKILNKKYFLKIKEPIIETEKNFRIQNI